VRFATPPPPPLSRNSVCTLRCVTLACIPAGASRHSCSLPRRVATLFIRYLIILARFAGLKINANQRGVVLDAIWAARDIPAADIKPGVGSATCVLVKSQHDSDVWHTVAQPLEQHACCTCRHGLRGVMCKHQVAAILYVGGGDIDESDVLECLGMYWGTAFGGMHNLMARLPAHKVLSLQHDRQGLAHAANDQPTNATAEVRDSDREEMPESPQQGGGGGGGGGGRRRRGPQDVARDKAAMAKLLEELQAVANDIDDPIASGAARAALRAAVTNIKSITARHAAMPELQPLRPLDEGRKQLRRRCKGVVDVAYGRKKTKKKKKQLVPTPPPVAPLLRPVKRPRIKLGTELDDTPPKTKKTAVARQPADEPTTAAAADHLRWRLDGNNPTTPRPAVFSEQPQSPPTATSLLTCADDARLIPGQLVEVWYEALTHDDEAYPAGWWAGRIASVTKHNLKVFFLTNQHDNFLIKTMCIRQTLRFF
jgi:hypothetical protein